MRLFITIFVKIVSFLTDLRKYSLLWIYYLQWG